jgi:hypothetical protein
VFVCEVPDCSFRIGARSYVEVPDCSFRIVLSLCLVRFMLIKKVGICGNWELTLGTNGDADCHLEIHPFL